MYGDVTNQINLYLSICGLISDSGFIGKTRQVFWKKFRKMVVGPVRPRIAAELQKAPHLML